MLSKIKNKIGTMFRPASRETGWAVRPPAKPTGRAVVTGRTGITPPPSKPAVSVPLGSSLVKPKTKRMKDVPENLKDFKAGDIYTFMTSEEGPTFKEGEAKFVTGFFEEMLKISAVMTRPPRDEAIRLGQVASRLLRRKEGMGPYPTKAPREVKKDYRDRSEKLRGLITDAQGQQRGIIKAIKARVGVDYPDVRPPVLPSAEPAPDTMPAAGLGRVKSKFSALGRTFGRLARPFGRS